MSSSSTPNNNQNINPKPCAYGCGIQIYCNTATSEYWEVFTKQKHSCPNLVNKPSISKPTSYPTASTTTSTKPTYYSKKPWNSNLPKPKMSNSFELLTGSTVAEIQKKYEILSDIVSEYNGKIHGSQRDIDPKTGPHRLTGIL